MFVAGSGGAGTGHAQPQKSTLSKWQGEQAAAALSSLRIMEMKMVAHHSTAARIAAAGGADRPSACMYAANSDAPAVAAPSANVWDAGRIATRPLQCGDLIIG
jgi:hypothetical protein